MKNIPPKQKNQDCSRKEISRTRKILIWIFIIGFWIFYYWYQGQKLPSRLQKSSQESPVKKDNQPPSANSLIGAESKAKRLK